MNWKEALEKMNKGEVVESVVSCTQYEIIDGQLMAEGLAVNEGYVTEEEKLGEFVSAKLVYSDSSDEDMSEFLDKTFKHAIFMDKHSEQKKKNTKK